LNSSDEKLTTSKYHLNLIAELDKFKTESPLNDSRGSNEKKEGARTSFTAGQVLKESEKVHKVPKGSLK
jgi:hypothetical protein